MCVCVYRQKEREREREREDTVLSGWGRGDIQIITFLKVVQASPACPSQKSSAEMNKSKL